VRPSGDFVVEALGPAQLRGRAAAVEVFAVERRRAASTPDTLATG
jgi:class 3 adenylate cyclase